MLYIFPFILWFFNLELNPGLGSVWIRTNVHGNKSFAPINVLNLMLAPLKHKFMWKISLFDTNIFTFYIFCALFYLLLDNTLSLLPKPQNKNWTNFLIKMNHY